MIFSRSGVLKSHVPKQISLLCSRIENRFHTYASEEEIPVPWGQISGKLWGKSHEQPIIALHGLFDNAATFDKLIPLLNIKRPILALDIPGFGKSSNASPGLQPNFLEIIFWLRYLFKFHFKWDKVSLMGHSFGSNLSFTYSGLFPNDVDMYISIDCAKLNMALKSEHLLDDFRAGYTGGVLKKLNVPEKGTYETFVNFMLASREKAGYPITKEMCDILLVRDLEKIDGNHYMSNVDRRPHLRYIGRSSLPFMDGLSKRINCECLFIRASDGLYNEKRLPIYEAHITNMKKNCPRVVSKVVSGGHHLHLEKPEDVAVVINDFFK